VSLTEPSNAVNAGMAIQAEGSGIALHASLGPQLDPWLVLVVQQESVKRVNCRKHT